jgi:hypothetical protein
MARFAQLLLKGGFASAFTSYLECYPGQVEHTRIVVPIRLKKVPYSLMAVVDTGAPWCVLDPDVARQAGTIEGEGDSVFGKIGKNRDRSTSRGRERY